MSIVKLEFGLIWTLDSRIWNPSPDNYGEIEEARCFIYFIRGIIEVSNTSILEL